MARELSVPVTHAADVEALYRAHVGALYAFIFSRVGNREAAEDLTSEVFLRTVAHIDPTREEHCIVAWLYRVARNALNDYWRARQGAEMISLERVREVRACALTPDVDRQERAARHARALLERLPDSYRTVLRHRLLEGLSIRETAALMATSPGNVKVLQHRALKRAVELREEEGADE